MKTNSDAGRSLSLTIGIYLIVKAVLNMALGGGFSLSSLLIALGATCLLFSGLQFLNYAVAAVMAFTVVRHLGNNISNLGNDWRYFVYLAEGVIDALCVIMLVFNSSIKRHFTNKWTEIGK